MFYKSPIPLTTELAKMDVVAGGDIIRFLEDYPIRIQFFTISISGGEKI